MDLNKLKQLDETSLKRMTEGKGPSDECICNLLYTPPPENKVRKSIKTSMMKALASLGGIKIRRKYAQVEKDVSMKMHKGKDGLYSTKELVQRTTPCGKCGCDSQNLVLKTNTVALKHSLVNIRVVAPDISSLCPCPEDCLPEKAKFNDIKVTVAPMLGAVESQVSGQMHGREASQDTRRAVSEPIMPRKSSILSLDDEKYDDFEYESSREDSDDEKRSEKLDNE